MTLTQRMDVCLHLIQQYQAEHIGLTQAMIGKPLSRECFKRDHEWMGYQRGWEEGRSIIEKGEGL